MSSHSLRQTPALFLRLMKRSGVCCWSSGASVSLWSRVYFSSQRGRLSWSCVCVCYCSASRFTSLQNTFRSHPHLRSAHRSLQLLVFLPFTSVQSVLVSLQGICLSVYRSIQLTKICSKNVLLMFLFSKNCIAIIQSIQFFLCFNNRYINASVKRTFHFVLLQTLCECYFWMFFELSETSSNI